MPLWNYNPIDLFNDVSNAYDKTTSWIDNAYDAVSAALNQPKSGMLQRKIEQPTNLQRYQPVDLYNDALREFEIAKFNLEKAYRGMFYGDEPARPTPTGQPMERLFDPEETMFYTSDYQDALRRYQEE